MMAQPEAVTGESLSYTATALNPPSDRGLHRTSILRSSTGKTRGNATVNIVEDVTFEDTATAW